MRSCSGLVVVLVVVVAGCGGWKPPVEPPLFQPSCPIQDQLSHGRPILAVQGQPVTVTLMGPGGLKFDSCGEVTATVEARAEDGTVVEATHALGLAPGGHTAVVTLTPSRPGKWTVTATWSTGGTSSQELTVARARTATAIVRRFVDRMDICLAPFVTLSGLTLCERSDGQVWVYGPDGTITDHFAGIRLAVRGDEVWSTQETGALEHRTALGTTLRLDGTLPFIRRDEAEGLTQLGRAVRGQYLQIIEVTWDGTTLAQHALADGYVTFPDYSKVITDGDTIWSEPGCLVQRGCTQSYCEPVFTCRPSAAYDLMALDAEGVWRAHSIGVAHGQTYELTLDRRPLSVTGERLTASLWEASPSAVPLIRRAMVERARLRFADQVVLPRLVDGTRIEFDAVPAGGEVMTVTDEWIVSQIADAFTLVLTPTPSRE